MELKFLGRGSAFNTKEGNTSAYYKLNNGEDMILIDCGESVFQQIINKNILNNVKNIIVLITHLDSDHVGSLSSLIHYCHYCCNDIKPNIYFPDEDILMLLELQGHKLKEDFTWNSPIRIKYLEIDSYPTKHIDKLNCYGYFINLPNGKNIWYSGDCSYPTNIDILFDIDEFYQDTCLSDYKGNVHTSLRLLCEKIPKEYVDYRNKIYCMHLDCGELIEKAKSEGFNVVECE